MSNIFFVGRYAISLLDNLELFLIYIYFSIADIIMSLLLFFVYLLVVVISVLLSKFAKKIFI